MARTYAMFPNLKCNVNLFKVGITIRIFVIKQNESEQQTVNNNQDQSDEQSKKWRFRVQDH